MTQADFRVPHRGYCAALCLLASCTTGGDDGAREENSSCPPTNQVETVPTEVRRVIGDAALAGDGRLYVAIADASWLLESASGYTLKLPWYRVDPGKVSAVAVRLSDGNTVNFNVDDGYGSRGVQPSSVTFPSSGCWEIRGTVGDAAASFHIVVPEA
jgi:hypothetical protein